MAQPHDGQDEHRAGGSVGGHGPAPHELGTMDISEQNKTFEGFVRFWVVVFGVSALVLIFLALFNS